MELPGLLNLCFLCYAGFRIWKKGAWPRAALGQAGSPDFVMWPWLLRVSRPTELIYCKDSERERESFHLGS